MRNHFIIAQWSSDSYAIATAAKDVGVEYERGPGPKCIAYFFTEEDLEKVKVRLTEMRDEVSVPLEGNIFIRSFNYEQEERRRKHQRLIDLCNTNRLGVRNEQLSNNQAPQEHDQPTA